MATLFRYIGADHVDTFFGTGELLLTTYKRCQEHEDSTRRDAREGKFNFFVRNPNGGAVGGVEGVGRRSYLLCLSSEHSDRLAAHFGADGVFAINDVDLFADAVGKSLPHGASLVKMQKGACRYKVRSVEAASHVLGARPDAETIRALEANDRAELLRLIERDQAAMANEMNALFKDEGYFIKGIEYEHESEFRIVWTIGDLVAAQDKVYCPEAIQYCEKVR